MRLPSAYGWFRTLWIPFVLLFAAEASAIGLGTPALDSGLGEPLRLTVPVTAQPDEDVGCIQIRARGNDLPGVFNTRTRVVRSGGQTSIEITSAQAVNEPAIGLVVSVGCTSAVAREFVIFLDPPLAAPEPAARIVAPRSVVEPTVPRGVAQPAPRRQAAQSASSESTTAADATTPSAPRAPRPKRPPRVRVPAAVPPSAVPPLATSSTAPPVAAAAPTTVTPSPKGGDRLSVAPAEPSPAARAAVAPPAAPNTASSTTSPAVDTSTSAAATAPAANGAGLPSDPATDIAAREQALRDQQEALQVQIRALTDQIGALRVQTTSLATRNQALENNAFSPLLVWFLIALAILATIVAAWLAWRYTQLRRELEGAPWWTNNTMAAGTASRAADIDDLNDPDDGELAPLGGGTRMAARPLTKTDTRASNVAAPGASQASDRSRPMGRSQGFQQAIETDFTVSDIEAAMATVRTVSPPRKAQPTSLEDSDFAPLGGPTLPSPFAEPPPPAKASQPNTFEDEPAEFLDIEIPPRPLSAGQPPLAKTEPLSPRPFRPTEVSEEFDPLATDHHKQTEIMPASAPAFEMQAMPTMLDFELPSVTQIASLTSRLDEPEPHGSTALDNLFDPEKTSLGPDTILDLDDRHGSPLSATEVDRLTGVPDGVEGLAGASMQVRMTRFADLMVQVDDVARTDPLRAITQLRQFVLRDENIPTLLWLRLFQLYQAVDKRMVYEALAEHFARRYHRPMVGWGEKLSDRAPQTPLSAFRELDAEIEAAWGTEAGLERLRKLLFDRDQDDAITFNAVVQRDLLDAAKIFLLDRDSSISRSKT